MKILQSNNISFKSLRFGPLNDEQSRNLINSRISKLCKVAKDADVYIKNENLTVEKIPDYEISVPVLKVSVGQLKDPETNSLISKKDSKIYALTYIYKTEGTSNSADDFVKSVKFAVDTVNGQKQFS